MGKLLIYCLSLSLLVLFIRCDDNILIQLEEKNKEKNALLAEDILSDIRSSFHSHGSVKRMNALKKALDLNPENANIWADLARPYLDFGYISKWSEYMDKAVSYDPLTFRGKRGYQYLFYLKDYNRALDDFKALDTITPGQTDFIYNLNSDYLRAICHTKVEEYGAALYYFDKYIDDESKISGLDFVNETAFLVKSIIYQELELWSSAIEAIDTAIELDNRMADYHFQKAKIYVAMNDFEMALPSIIRAKKEYLEYNYNYGRYGEGLFQIYLSDITDLETMIKSNGIAMQNEE